MSDRRATMNALTVGTVLVGALALLIVSVVWLRTAGVAVATRDLDVYFWNIGGRLSQGATVRLAGVRIGSVTDISMAPRPDIMAADSAHATQDTVVRVRCAIDRAVVIRDSYLVRVNATNLVGDSYIEITPVSDAGAPLSPGQALVGLAPTDPFDLLPTAEESLAEVGSAAKELNRALAEEDLTGELVDAAIQVAMTATADAATDLGLMGDNLPDLLHHQASLRPHAIHHGDGRMVEITEGLVGEVTVAVRRWGPSPPAWEKRRALRTSRG